MILFRQTRPSAKNDPIAPDFSYAGRTAVFATMHGKERVVRRPILRKLGISLLLPTNLDTDEFGTFSGERERVGNQLQAAESKIVAALKETGLSVGFASEGSFGPDPQSFGLTAINNELMLFLDEDLGIKISESLTTRETNYTSKVVGANENIDTFLKHIRFRTHALIVKPNQPKSIPIVVKGIRELSVLQRAIKDSAQDSLDQKALIITDMRAHMNPLRMWAIRKLAHKLADRINTRCEDCASPGWGIVNREPGLPCESCGEPTYLFATEVYGCARCTKLISKHRSDGLLYADEEYCERCSS